MTIVAQPTVLTAGAELAILAERVHTTWDRARTQQISAWESYLDIGDLLFQARQSFKANRDYGHWFEAQGFGFGTEWARRLVQLAENRPAVMAVLASALANGTKPPGVDSLLALVNPPARHEPRDLISRPVAPLEGDHLRRPIVEIMIHWPHGTTRRVAGEAHGSGADRAEWHAEFAMASDMPTALIEMDSFVNELGRHLWKEVRDRPFLTMRR